MTLPHVIGLMATRNRPALAHRAAHQFFDQEYLGKLTLLVDDDSPDEEGFEACTHLETPVSRRCPGSSLIHVIRALTVLPRKRNLMALEAIKIDPDAIYIIWDDDDFHSHNRVRLQAAALTGTAADGCVIHPFLCFDQRDPFVKRCSWPLHDTWPHVRTANSSLAFRKSFFERVPWPEEHDPGSSWRQLAAQPKEKILGLDGGDIRTAPFCHVRWGGNHAGDPDTTEPGWEDTTISAMAMHHILNEPLSCQ